LGRFSANGTFTSGSDGVIDRTVLAQIWMASTTAAWLLRTVFRISSWALAP